MKKTVISAALMMAGLSSAAYAFTDAVDGNWSGQLDFAGAIAHGALQWSYEIPSTTQTEIGNLDVRADDANVAGSNSEWKLNDATGLSIFEAQFNHLLTKGVPGTQPQLKLDGTEILSIIDGSTPADFTVEALGDGGEKGTLTVRLVGNGASMSDDGSMYKCHIFGSDSSRHLAQIENVASNEGHTNHACYSPGPYYGTIEDLLDSYVDITALNQTTSYNLVLQDAPLLSFPSTTIPDAWTATVPLEVSYK